MTPRSSLRLPIQATISLLAAFVSALIVVSGATRWLPQGDAQIDHIVVPLVTFPIVWVVFAVTLYASRRRGRAWAIMGGLVVLNILLLAQDHGQVP